MTTAPAMTDFAKTVNAVVIRSSVWLGIRRIINDFRTPKNKCRNRSNPVDSLTISGYRVLVMKNIIRIQRPSGEVELKDITAKWPTIMQADYDKMVKVTREMTGSIILGFAEGGITTKAELAERIANLPYSNSRRTVAAILGGSLDENDDTSDRALRGGFSL